MAAAATDSQGARVAAVGDAGDAVVAMALSPGARKGAKPIHPVSVEARNLTYIIGKRTITNNVTIAISPGRCVARRAWSARPPLRMRSCTAIMGPSGSGKTTLLSLLAGCIEGTSGQVCAECHVASSEHAACGAPAPPSAAAVQILMNGEVRGRDVARKYSAFIPQDDMLISAVTVEEALTIASHVRLPGMTNAERKEHVTCVALPARGITA